MIGNGLRVFFFYLYHVIRYFEILTPRMNLTKLRLCVGKKISHEQQRHFLTSNSTKACRIFGIIVIQLLRNKFCKGMKINRISQRKTHPDGNDTSVSIIIKRNSDEPRVKMSQSFLSFTFINKSTTGKEAIQIKY